MLKTDVRFSVQCYVILFHCLEHTLKYRPPPCGSQWKYECSLGGCTSPSSPAKRKNFRLVAIFFWDYLLTCIPHWANPPHSGSQRARSSSKSQSLISQESYHTEVIISKSSRTCNPSIMANNLNRWLLFISAIQKKIHFFLWDNEE